MDAGRDGALSTETSGTPSLAEVMAAACSLADLMTSHGLTRLDFSVGDVAIRLRSSGEDAAPRATPSQAEASPEQIETSPQPEGHVITAPMIGTFYTAAAPGEPPFVRVGDHVQIGQVIGIIEAMKIMNEIAADQSGVVQEILVQNAQAVEYGSPLMRVAV